MTKIAKIIDTCNDCESCFYASTSKETRHYAICEHIDVDSFLLHVSNDPAVRYKLAIPENCPLEDYSGNQKLSSDDE